MAHAAKATSAPGFASSSRMYSGRCQRASKLGVRGDVLDRVPLCHYRGITNFLEAIEG